MVLDSNNKSNEVDLACVFLFPKDKRGPFLSKRVVGCPNFRNRTVKSRLCSVKGDQTSAPGNACYSN